MILDPDDSYLGRFTAAMLDLIKNFSHSGEPDGKWFPSFALEVSIEDANFVKWIRAQVLRMNTAMSRRCELRFSSLPYPLYALPSEKFSPQQKFYVAHQTLQAAPKERGIYADGIVKSFDTTEKLLSAEFAHIIDTDLTNHPYGIDDIERLNSEVSRLHAVRGSAREFGGAAEEAVLSQAAKIHMANGGKAPLAPDRLQIEDAHRREQVFYHPLLSLQDLGKLFIGMKINVWISHVCIINPM